MQEDPRVDQIDARNSTIASWVSGWSLTPAWSPAVWTRLAVREPFGERAGRAGGDVVGSRSRSAPAP